MRKAFSQIALLLTVAASPATAAQRALAVTIDDLPAPPAGVVSNDPAALAAMTERLLAGLVARGVPAIGFVNEGKLHVAGERMDARASRISVLRQWTAAGFELGNHTYSHRSLNRESLTRFEEDVIRGEPTVRALLAARGHELRYFRHPFLQVGLELPKRRAFEAFLAARGYAVAPVTIDNDEWIFAFLYADARRAGDAALAERLAAAYLDYMESVFAFCESLSTKLFDREIPQILLVHANELNADHLGTLLDRAAARGYRFVPLDEALRDPAFAEPDDYVGAWGISWLHHWELTRGLPRSPSPDPPAWVLEAHEAREAAAN